MATRTITTSADQVKSPVYWTARNNSTYMVGYRSASSMRAAVRAAREYVDNELYQEGIINYYNDLPQLCFGPIREDEKSIFTKFQWVTR